MEFEDFAELHQDLHQRRLEKANVVNPEGRLGDLEVSDQVDQEDHRCLEENGVVEEVIQLEVHLTILMLLMLLGCLEDLEIPHFGHTVL